MNLNSIHEQNKSFVTKAEQNNQKRLVKEFKKEVEKFVENNPHKFIKKIFLNHSQEYKEFKDITEEEQEKEATWAEQFS